jgi:hypothetical protein
MHLYTGFVSHYYELYLLAYLLTHSMVQDIIRKDDSHSACQKISYFLYGTRRFITVFTKARHWTIKELFQVRGALKHFATINIFTVRGC